ncbi:glutamate 5-kinase [Sneathiella limimaris]|uniref:glutamate 5-kinase n=1 Tax=Sneathiella limimaris TaxID=1964213 RepID=UPI00146D7475|nr:glutamate 5-kinase [Sneathiella limimaris]
MAALIDRFTKAKRIVIKIGSALLVNEKTGMLRRDWLTALAEDIQELRSNGQEVLIVSSGSIAIGRRILGLKKGRLKLEESQAAAATGQIHLAHAYQEILGDHDLKIAQILLTLGDTEERRKYLNARSTLSTLLNLGVIPVINENDTVATSEIRYGDNDRLGARVAQMMGADCLILLSDIDGLYTADPSKDPNAEFIAKIPELTEKIMAMGGGVQTAFGSGGMITKLQAAEIAVSAGCNMLITSGKVNNPLSKIKTGESRFSCFLAKDTPRNARKKWIAGSLGSQGALIIDSGAEKALQKGKSLLPAGVSAIQGEFERGDLVTLINSQGKELGHGLTAYSSKDAELIIGQKSSEIVSILGYAGRDEMIHRDELALK